MMAIDPGTLTALLGADLTDDCCRLVLADALEDSDRPGEAATLRDLDRPVRAEQGVVTGLLTYQEANEIAEEIWAERADDIETASALGTFARPLSIEAADPRKGGPRDRYRVSDGLAMEHPRAMTEAECRWLVGDWIDTLCE